MSRFRYTLIAICVVALCAVGVALASVTSDVLQKFTQLEQQYALPSGSLAKIAQVESGGNASARANGSSAAGLFQWLERSWYYASTAAYNGNTRPSSDRYNPYIAAEVTAYSLAQTKAKLGSQIQAVGLDMTVGIYMGHFLGIGGASKFFANMARDPSRSAALDFPREAAANPGVFRNGSYANIANFFARKLGQQGIASVTGYNGTADPNEPRIIDAAGAASLAQRYSGPAPAADPTRTYQTTAQDYASPAQSQSQVPAYQPLSQTMTTATVTPRTIPKNTTNTTNDPSIQFNTNFGSTSTTSANTNTATVSIFDVFKGLLGRTPTSSTSTKSFPVTFVQGNNPAQGLIPSQGVQFFQLGQESPAGAFAPSSGSTFGSGDPNGTSLGGGPQNSQLGIIASILSAMQRILAQLFQGTTAVQPN
jgi:hypothetical protein